MATDPFMWATEGAAGMQGTVLIKNAEELEGYSRSEEDRLEALIKGIADSGARVLGLHLLVISRIVFTRLHMSCNHCRCRFR